MNDYFEVKIKDLIFHSSDPDFNNYLEQQIIQNSSDFNHFQFCIKYFSSFDAEPLIYYALCIFRSWINIDISLELLLEIKNIFFSKIKFTTNIIDAIQISGQIQIFLKVYPVLMPNFWIDFFLIDIPHKVRLNFLSDFSDLFIDNQLKKQHRLAILNQMKIDNSKFIIVHYLLQIIANERNENVLLVLAKILTFIDPFESNQNSNEVIDSIQSLTIENILPMILNDLSQMPQFIFDKQIELNDQNSIQIISNHHQTFLHLKNIITLVYRIISTNFSHIQILQQLIPQFFDKINSIFQLSINLLNQLFDIHNSQLSLLFNEVYNNLKIDLTNDIYSILIAIGNFISSCSLKFNNSELMQSFYLPISLSLLRIPNDEVSISVVNILKSFAIEAHSEKVKTIFFSLGNRLTIFYLKNSIETNEFLSLLETAFKTILSKVNKETKILDFYVNSILTNHSEILSSIIESFELKQFKNIDQQLFELPLFSSMLKILDIAKDKYINFDNIDSVLIGCKSLLDIKPPISSQQFFSITYFMRYVKRNESRIDASHPIFQLVFDSLFVFLIYGENLNNFVDGSNEAEQISEAMKNKFISIANDFISIRNFTSKISISIEQIILLVRTCNDSIVLFASKIISKIPDEETKFNLFSQCLNSKMELFQNSQNQIESILSMLLFIQYQSSGIDEDEPQTNLILSFLEQLFETAFTNENIMAKYLTTIQKVLDDKGINLFIHCVNRIYNEFNSLPCFSIDVLSLVCKIASIYIQHDEDGGWRIDTFSKIFDLIVFHRDFGVQDWRSKESEEVREIAILLGNFFSLVSHSCHFLGPDKNLQVLNYLNDHLNILFELVSTDPLLNSFNYLFTLTNFLITSFDDSFSQVVVILIERFLCVTFCVFKNEHFEMISKWKPVVEMVFKFNQNLMKLNHDATHNILCSLFEQLPQSEKVAAVQNLYIQFLCSDQSFGSVEDKIEEIFKFLHDECNPY